MYRTLLMYLTWSVHVFIDPNIELSIGTIRVFQMIISNYNVWNIMLFIGFFHIFIMNYHFPFAVPLNATYNI